MLGTGWVLAVNAVSYAAIVLSVLRMDGRRLWPAPLARGSGAIRQGWAYVVGRPDILLLSLIHI